ncbi:MULTISPECIES: ExbD/TolR family protein [Cetobacterium]|jgi:biopolymer transport protein ExbD|uniref:Biopolymer transporter ExbD n=1 Tax=Candidatus Cetobacterium colombiensis TaxID=3073100 RepID=A0ABU4W7M3_9FUSO|nr:biopolymer transporter ExbD [Candidatus Cetobacterium colombiensis]MDX8335517.1 biopolymer transporter ExbD [Candidatus Cetobacterium colombiensis]
MKLNRIKRRSGNSLILELTPLIDVVFLLLIFFLVATTFEDVNSSIKIDLPTSTVKSAKPVNELQVIVTKDREYFISYKDKGVSKREKINAKELKEALAQKLADSADKNVIISADKSVSHGVIVDTMTAAKEAGAISLDIDTASPGK